MSAPRSGINWSVVVPAETTRPKQVERACAEVERLRALVADEAEALAAATAALDEAEKADVQALASAFRSGSTAKAQTPKIEQARAAVREHERRVEAARAAHAAAEADVGVELHAQREAWLVDVERETEKVRTACRAHLDELGDGLARLATLRGLALWLGGEELAKAPRTRGLGGAPGSARFMANASAADGGMILDWARELVDPPARPEPPTLRVPEPRVSAPVEAG